MEGIKTLPLPPLSAFELRRNELRGHRPFFFSEKRARDGLSERKREEALKEKNSPGYSSSLRHGRERG